MNRLAQEAHAHIVQALVQLPALGLGVYQIGDQVNFVQLHLLRQHFDGAVGVSDGGRIVLHHDEAALASSQKSQHRGRDTSRHIDDEVVNFFTQVAECLHDAGRLQLA